jgi:hypothetical protein
LRYCAFQIRPLGFAGPLRWATGQHHQYSG